MAKIKLTRNRLLAVGAVLVFLAAVGGIVVRMNLSTLSNSQKEEPTVHAPLEDVQATALEYANNNDIDGGLKYFDEQIEERQDNDEKKRLLLAKSNFALGADRNDTAISAAEQANEISSDIASTEALARSYAASGDKEQAIIYYKKVLELSSKEGSSDRYSPIWEERIAELEQ